MVVGITGRDTVSINGIIFNDFADAECFALTFPNPVSVLKTGKNGNTLYGYAHSGKMCKVVLSLIRGTANDKYLNQEYALFRQNPSLFTLLTGVFVKNIGDGSGNIISDTYTLSGGAFEFEPDAKENADGDVEQSKTIWKLHFSNAPRSIG